MWGIIVLKKLKKIFGYGRELDDLHTEINGIKQKLDNIMTPPLPEKRNPESSERTRDSKRPTRPSALIVKESFNVDKRRK